MRQNSLKKKKIHLRIKTNNELDQIYTLILSLIKTTKNQNFKKKKSYFPAYECRQKKKKNNLKKKLTDKR